MARLVPLDESVGMRETDESVRQSPISFWEISTPVEKNRIALDRPLFEWIRDLLDDEGIELAPLSARAAVETGLLGGLGFDGDPVDAMPYATAREFAVPLVLKHSRIHEFARTARDARSFGDRARRVALISLGLTSSPASAELGP